MAWYDNMGFDPQQLYPLLSRLSSQLSPNDMQAGQSGPMATPVRWPTPRTGMTMLNRGKDPKQYGSGGNIPGLASRYGFPPASPPVDQPQGQDLSGMNWRMATPPTGAQEPPVGVLNVDTNSGMPGYQSPSVDYAPNSFTTVRAPASEQPGPPQSTIFGLSPERFALMAGVAAHAIDPYGVGGRLGSGAATLAAQDLRGQEAQQIAVMQGRQRQQAARAAAAYNPGQYFSSDPSNPNAELIQVPDTGVMNVPPGNVAIRRNMQPGDKPLYESARTLNPNQTLVGSDTKLPYQAPPGPLNPSQTIPPTNIDSSIGYTAPAAPMNTGPGHAATVFPQGGPPVLGPLVPPLPSQMGQSFAPGSTFRTGPGQPLQVATPTTGQNVKFGGPGTTPYIGQGAGQPVKVGPQAPTVPSQGARQQTTGAPAGGKPSKPTQFDKQVEAWANEFSNYLPTEDTTWLGGYAGTPSLSPQQQAQEKIKKMAISDPTSARIMQQAYFQAFGGGKGSNVPSSVDPLEGRTASGPNGPIIRRNGQWIPYNGR